MTKDDSIESDILSLVRAFGLSRMEAIREVKILFAHAIGLGQLDLIKEPSLMSDPLHIEKYKKAFQDRINGKPIAYILGEKEFYGLSFKVNEHVLIPRPETELLVDVAIEKIQSHNLKRVLDLGTGSGAISISVAINAPGVDVVAADISKNALKVAEANVRSLCPSASISFVESNWFSKISGTFDLILANPPYIAADDSHLNSPELRYEPIEALVSGPEGLDAISEILEQGQSFLNEGGWLFFEHGYDQLGRCQDLLAGQGFMSLFNAVDLSGNPRISGGRIGAVTRTAYGC